MSAKIRELKEKAEKQGITNSYAVAMAVAHAVEKNKVSGRELTFEERTEIDRAFHNPSFELLGLDPDSY